MDIFSLMQNRFMDTNKQPARRHAIYFLRKAVSYLKIKTSYLFKYLNLVVDGDYIRVFLLN